MMNSSITRRLAITVLKNGIVIEIQITNRQLDPARATTGVSIRSSRPTSSLSNEIKLQSATNFRVNKSLVERRYKPNPKSPRFVMVFHGTTQSHSVANLARSWTKTWEGFRR